MGRSYSSRAPLDPDRDLTESVLRLEVPLREPCRDPEADPSLEPEHAESRPTEEA